MFRKIFNRTEIPEYICEWCNISFSKKHYLNKHLYKGTCTRLCFCSVCGNQYKFTAPELGNHKRICRKRICLLCNKIHSYYIA